MLLLRYNKVTNEALESLYRFLQSFQWEDISKFGDQTDILKYSVVAEFLQSLKPFDSICIGDIFWETGQNICKWCADNRIKVYFIQHGQWIYIQNKRNPRYLPYSTFLYGDNILNMVSNWPYAKRSKIYAVGNPRYDNIQLSNNGEYVYFAPPVIKEISPSVPSKSNADAAKLLSQLEGLDDVVTLVIHPHYREGNVDYIRNIFPKAVIANPSESSLSLIQKSSKVITHRNSTTVLDAIACGKKIILTNFLGQDKSFFPRGYFGDFAVENNWPKDCFAATEVDYYIDYAGYTERAKAHIYLGNSSQRIVDILKQDGIM